MVGLLNDRQQRLVTGRQARDVIASTDGGTSVCAPPMRRSCGIAASAVAAQRDRNCDLCVLARMTRLCRRRGAQLTTGGDQPAAIAGRTAMRGRTKAMRGYRRTGDECSALLLPATSCGSAARSGADRSISKYERHLQHVMNDQGVLEARVRRYGSGSPARAGVQSGGPVAILSTAGQVNNSLRRDAVRGTYNLLAHDATAEEATRSINANDVAAIAETRLPEGGVLRIDRQPGNNGPTSVRWPSA